MLGGKSASQQTPLRGGGNLSSSASPSMVAATSQNNNFINKKPVLSGFVARAASAKTSTPTKQSTTMAPTPSQNNGGYKDSFSRLTQVNVYPTTLAKTLKISQPVYQHGGSHTSSSAAAGSVVLQSQGETKAKHLSSIAYTDASRLLSRNHQQAINSSPLSHQQQLPNSASSSLSSSSSLTFTTPVSKSTSPQFTASRLAVKQQLQPSSNVNVLNSPVFTISLFEQQQQLNPQSDAAVIPTYIPHFMNSPQSPSQSQQSSPLTSVKQTGATGQSSTDHPPRKAAAAAPSASTSFQEPHPSASSMRKDSLKGSLLRTVSPLQRNSTSHHNRYSEVKQISSKSPPTVGGGGMAPYSSMTSLRQKSRECFTDVNEANQSLQACIICKARRVKPSASSNTTGPYCVKCAAASSANTTTTVTPNEYPSNGAKTRAPNKMDEYFTPSADTSTILSPSNGGLSTPPPLPPSLHFHDFAQARQPYSTQLVPFEKKTTQIQLGGKQILKVVTPPPPINRGGGNYSRLVVAQEMTSSQPSISLAPASPMPVEIGGGESSAMSNSNEQEGKRLKLETFSKKLQSAKASFEAVQQDVSACNERSIEQYHSDLNFIEQVERAMASTLESITSEKKQMLMSSFNDSLTRCKSRKFQISQILNYLNSTEKDLLTNLDSIIQDMDMESLEDIIAEYSAMIANYETTRNEEIINESIEIVTIAHNHPQSSLFDKHTILTNFTTALRSQIASLLATHTKRVALASAGKLTAATITTTNAIQQHIDINSLQSTKPFMESASSIAGHHQLKPIYISFENRDGFQNSLNPMLQSPRLSSTSSDKNHNSTTTITTTTNNNTINTVTNNNSSNYNTNQTSCILSPQQHAYQLRTINSPETKRPAETQPQSPTFNTSLSFQHSSLTNRLESLQDKQQNTGFKLEANSSSSNGFENGRSTNNDYSSGQWNHLQQVQQQQMTQRNNIGSGGSVKAESTIKTISYEIHKVLNGIMLPNSKESSSFKGILNTCGDVSSQGFRGGEDQIGTMAQSVHTSSSFSGTDGLVERAKHLSSEANTVVMMTESEEERLLFKVNHNNGLRNKPNLTSGEDFAIIQQQQQQQFFQKANEHEEQQSTATLNLDHLSQFKQPIRNKQKYNNLISRIQLNQSHTEKLCTDVLSSGSNFKFSLATGTEDNQVVRSSLQVPSLKQ